MLWLLFLLTCMALPAGAEESTKQLKILTSFPPEFYTPFVEKFETLHPGTTVSVLNKKTTAAIDEILRGNDRQFDLFWSSSVDAFDLLKSEHVLRRTHHLRVEPTVTLKNLSLDDPDGYFLGFAVSGIGWMWHNSYLKKANLPVPGRWEDLEDPIYYGHLAMSTPSRSGTTHLIVENILQKYGWKNGWAYLLRISGNFATVTARSFGVPEGIESGRFGIGLVIDFLAHTESNSEIGFSYGKPAFPVPAGIAGLNNSLNHSVADQFIGFVLSQKGQQILLRPEINRLPVHRDLLIQQQDKAMKLLQLVDRAEPQAYDVNLSRQRYNLVNKLFDQLITFRLRERRHTWKRLIDLEKYFSKTNRDFNKVRPSILESIGRIPVSEQQSLDPSLNRALTSSLSRGQASHDEQRKIIASWDDFIRQQLSQTEALLDGIEQTLKATKK